MASFAEIKSENDEVLRIVVINNSDVDTNGGELSTQAETWVSNFVPQCGIIKEKFLGTYPNTYWKQCSFSKTWVSNFIPQCEIIKHHKFSGNYPSTYWKQCSFSNAFRNKYPDHPESTYDKENDVFIYPKPYPSWVLNENFDWKAPVTRPENYRDQVDANGETYKLKLNWDESNLRWTAIDRLNPKNWIYWNPNINEWVKTGETYDG